MTKLSQKGSIPGASSRHGVSTRLIYIGAMMVSCLLICSCLDMPDIRVIERENLPPVIDKSSVSPNSSVVRVDSSCRKEFSFSMVTESDTDDMLYVRWYVDYDIIKNYQKSSVIAPLKKKSITRGGDSFSLDIRNSILPNKARGSLHTIEVMVSDRPFVIDSAVAPAFKAIEEGGNYDYISWTVIQLDDCY